MFTRAMPPPALIAPADLPADPVSVDALLGRPKVFEAVAGARWNRTAGLPGYDASADLVAAGLREAGYTVELQPFTFDFYREPAPAALIGKRQFVGVSTMCYRGSDDVTARSQRAARGLPLPQGM
jgi:hypothetical protein